MRSTLGSKLYFLQAVELNNRGLLPFAGDVTYPEALGLMSQQWNKTS